MICHKGGLTGSHPPIGPQGPLTGDGRSLGGAPGDGAGRLGTPWDIGTPQKLG
jgi:hypothetical protein